MGLVISFWCNPIGVSPEICIGVMHDLSLEIVFFVGFGLGQDTGVGGLTGVFDFASLV